MSQVAKTASKFLILQQTMPTTHFTSKLQPKLPILAIESYRGTHSNPILWSMLSDITKPNSCIFKVDSQDPLNSHFIQVHTFPQQCHLATMHSSHWAHYVLYLSRMQASHLYQSSPYFQSKKHWQELHCFHVKTEIFWNITNTTGVNQFKWNIGMVNWCLSSGARS